MQKVLWIHSINVNGGIPFGYSPNQFWPQAKKLQVALKEALQSDVELHFISYDVKSNEIPAADLIVYNEMDLGYLPEELKRNSLCIASQDIYSNDIEKMKNSILTFLKQAEVHGA